MGNVKVREGELWAVPRVGDGFRSLLALCKRTRAVVGQSRPGFAPSLAPRGLKTKMRTDMPWDRGARAGYVKIRDGALLALLQYKRGGIGLQGSKHFPHTL